MAASGLAIWALVFAAAAPAAFSSEIELVADPALASLTDQQLVDARQTAMKENGKALRAAQALAGAEALTAATTLLQNFTNFPLLFREGSLTANSRALPLIWAPDSRFDEFIDEAKIAARVMRQAAESGDNAYYLAAVDAIGSACNECHSVYRSQEDPTH
jgi:cytochrome c556